MKGKVRKRKEIQVDESHRNSKKEKSVAGGRDGPRFDTARKHENQDETKGSRLKKLGKKEKKR